MSVRNRIFFLLKALQLNSFKTKYQSFPTLQLTCSRSYHIPVMKAECCKYLNIKPGSVYLDCTLGGGGHTLAILEHGGKVIGIDRVK